MVCLLGVNAACQNARVLTPGDIERSAVRDNITGKRETYMRGKVPGGKEQHRDFFE